ncbi:hypothetical protein DFH06DRAFT_1149957 [Mycena polygramma]|nr:hypothetical protein DFH06DRAFT_1149957 [Mycena polygramma]
MRASTSRPPTRRKTWPDRSQALPPAKFFGQTSLRDLRSPDQRPPTLLTLRTLPAAPSSARGTSLVRFSRSPNATLPPPMWLHHPAATWNLSRRGIRETLPIDATNFWVTRWFSGRQRLRPLMDSVAHLEQHLLELRDELEVAEADFARVSAPGWVPQRLDLPDLPPQPVERRPDEAAITAAFPLPDAIADEIFKPRFATVEAVRAAVAANAAHTEEQAQRKRERNAVRGERQLAYVLEKQKCER